MCALLALLLPAPPSFAPSSDRAFLPPIVLDEDNSEGVCPSSFRSTALPFAAIDWLEVESWVRRDESDGAAPTEPRLPVLTFSRLADLPRAVNPLPELDPTPEDSVVDGVPIDWFGEDDRLLLMVPSTFSFSLR
uniref:Putative secreted protein n=1 Tax=Anopheles triannulatus TaxID=58253 RepID=A0A2M4B3C3_9DIPT